MSRAIRDILIGLFVAIVGGVAVAWIIQDGARFQPAGPALDTPTPSQIDSPANLSEEVPLLYDDFSDVVYTDNFNQAKWIAYENTDPSHIAQKNGLLTVKKENNSGAFVGLVASEFNGFRIGNLSKTSPFFIEASIMLDPDYHFGPALLNLGAILPNGETFWAQCYSNDDGTKAWIYCWDKNVEQESTQGEYRTPEIQIERGSWHTCRIEVDLNSFQFTFLVDGQIIGIHTPDDANEFHASEFWVSMGVWSDNPAIGIGHFDNVRIGQ